MPQPLTIGELTVRLDAEDFIKELKSYEETLKEFASAIKELQANIHTLGNALSGKLSVREAEIVARQVARETVEIIMQEKNVSN